MKELLNTIAGKLSGICKSVFVAHAKACIIAGSGDRSRDCNTGRDSRTC